MRSLPGETLMAIEYLDARSPDGWVRKYRVMMVDGRLYPLHLAVSNDWKVHYFSADMAENAANRTEDERFLGGMDGGPRAGGDRVGERAGPRSRPFGAGLRGDRLLACRGLDGRDLFFEANATMIVPEPPAGERFRYRRAPVKRIVDAVRAMLVAPRQAPGGCRTAPSGRRARATKKR